MNKKGLLIVVSAPSGCGKGTILNEILKDEGYYFSVSATTRAPRPGEKNGINYYFLSKEEFEERIKNGQMLEYARYCGNYYGTPKAETEKKLDDGMNVILEIEVKGAAQIKKKCPDAVTIFILPPSIEELENRLRKRGTETEDVISQRVEAARGEIEYAADYDYIIVNDRLEDAVSDFRAVIRAQQLKNLERGNLL